MNKILVIDPGKGWGHFVSKMYCYQKLSEYLNAKIVFLTKRSTQAADYLKSTNFCEDVIYLKESKKGILNTLDYFKSFIGNVKSINKFNFKYCFVFHPSLRYLLIANFSHSNEIWGLGLKYQNFFIKNDRRLYSNFFSKTVNDNETYEFVKKITHSSSIKFKPLYSINESSRDTIGIIIAASGHEKKWSINNYLEIINYLKKKNYKKFLIISGIDQSKEEELIKESFKDELEFTFTASKKIDEVITYLKYCKFCIGNDTGFSHLSVNLDIETLIIYGNCIPQSYSSLINHIDIDDDIKRSSSSINTITTEKVLTKLSEFLHRRGGRAV
jgi:ADP-heptose:LPS heptosyltransferase